MKKIMLIVLIGIFVHGVVYCRIDDKSKQTKKAESKSTPKFQTINTKKKKFIWVNSPAGGNHKTGQKLSIKWTTSWKVGSNEKFFISLYSSNGKIFKKNIGRSKPGRKDFVWEITGISRPDLYTIKVYQPKIQQISKPQENIAEGISPRFRIGWGYKDKPTTFSLKSQKIDNIAGAAKFANEGNPGPGVIRVGWSGFYPPKWKSLVVVSYRSHVCFSIDSLPRDGRLVEAQLKYKKHSGCECPIEVFILDRKYYMGILSRKEGYNANPKDFKQVVQKWLNYYPNANHGILFYPRSHSLPYCLVYLSNPRLVVKIRERIK